MYLDTWGGTPSTVCWPRCMFRDPDFAGFYCADNGRDSVPPSLLARRSCSSPTTRRADFDIRWKVALGIEVEDRPFAKSTLQVFRA